MKNIFSNSLQAVKLRAANGFNCVLYLILTTQRTHFNNHKGLPKLKSRETEENNLKDKLHNTKTGNNPDSLQKPSIFVSC